MPGPLWGQTPNATGDIVRHAVRPHFTEVIRAIYGMKTIVHEWKTDAHVNAEPLAVVRRGFRFHIACFRWFVSFVGDHCDYGGSQACGTTAARS